MFCKTCGIQLREGAAFCPTCGTPVSQAAPQQTVNAPYEPYSQQTATVTETVEQPVAETPNRVLKFCTHPMMVLLGFFMAALTLWRGAEFMRFLGQLESWTEALEEMDGAYAFNMVMQLLSSFVVPVASLLIAVGLWKLISAGYTRLAYDGGVGCTLLRAGIWVQLSAFLLNFLGMFVVACDTLGQLDDMSDSMQAEYIDQFLYLIVYGVLAVFVYVKLSALVQSLSSNILLARSQDLLPGLRCTGGVLVAVLILASLLLTLYRPITFNTNVSYTSSVLIQAVLSVLAQGVLAFVAALFNFKMLAIRMGRED